jgi:tRNA-dihydrouridine synthase
MNFWEKLDRPIFALAPMEDVTDAAFRSIIARYSKKKGCEYVTFTEFTSADGIVFACLGANAHRQDRERGQKKLHAKLHYEEAQRPIVAQIFSAIPDHIQKAAAFAKKLGFDGVDINMGCPDRAVEKQGAGAALIKNSNLAKEILLAAKEGAGDLPVSVKTRVGYNDVQLEAWLHTLLETAPAAITLHARTRDELSKVPARWELLKEAVAIRDAFYNSKENENSRTLIIGNGDVRDLAHGRELAEESGVDGVMIGRGMFGNPWIMSEHVPTVEEKLKTLIEHTAVFEKELAGIKSFATMRKHFSSYVEGFAGAKELRTKLMKCNTAREVETVIRGHQTL